MSTVRITSLPTYADLKTANSQPRFWFGDDVQIDFGANSFVGKIDGIQYVRNCDARFMNTGWHYHVIVKDDPAVNGAWVAEYYLTTPEQQARQSVNVLMWVMIAVLIVAAFFGYYHQKCEKSVDGVARCHYIHR
jgi:hypothetical protein